MTCHLPGFGKEGRVTWDWKHFPYEDYDEWLFGEDGVWSSNVTQRVPDVLVMQVSLHTCVHALDPHRDNYHNDTMIKNHEKDYTTLMNAIAKAINRPNVFNTKTKVILMTGGRNFLKARDYRAHFCQYRLNRIASHQAHLHGFPVFEREEIEHRYLFKSEYAPGHKNVQSHIHLDIPGPQIITTALLAMISCLEKNGSNPRFNSMKDY